MNPLNEVPVMLVEFGKRLCPGGGVVRQSASGEDVWAREHPISAPTACMDRQSSRRNLSAARVDVDAPQCLKDARRGLICCDAARVPGVLQHVVTPQEEVPRSDSGI